MAYLFNNNRMLFMFKVFSLLAGFWFMTLRPVNALEVIHEEYPSGKRPFKATVRNGLTKNKRKGDPDQYLKKLKKEQQRKKQREKSKALAQKAPVVRASFKYGAGLALGAGETSGFTGLYSLDNQTYLQAHLGITFLSGTLMLTSDYVYEAQNIFSPGTAPYVGLGGLVFIGDAYDNLASQDSSGSVYIGARLPVGIYTIPEDLPAQFFAQISPGLLVVPAIKPTLGILLGARWLF